MPVTKKGAKVLMKDHADLKKNAPKIEKDGDMFIVKIYSNVNKGYISVAEYHNMKTARADLKHFQRDHKDTLAKIIKLSKDVIKENTLDETSDAQRKKNFNKSLKGFLDDNAKKLKELKAKLKDKAMASNHDIIKSTISALEMQDKISRSMMKEGVNEGFKPGDKVKFSDKSDDFYGKTGEIYKTFKATKKKNAGYTVKVGSEVVSREDDELVSEGCGKTGHKSKKIVKATKKKTVKEEGFGADSQRKSLEQSDKEREAIKKKYKGDKKLLDKAEEFWNKNWKPEAGLNKAKKALGIKESLDGVDVISIYERTSKLNEAGKIAGETVFIDFDNGFYMITGTKSLYVYEYLETMKDAKAYAKKNKLTIK